MTKITDVHKYLEKAINEIEIKIKSTIPEEIFELVEKTEEILNYDFLKDSQNETEPKSKYEYNEHLINLYIPTISLIVKAKKSLEAKKTTQTIEILLNYYFQLGKIDQDIKKEEVFQEKASNRSKTLSDRRYAFVRKIKEKACDLLYKEKPINGWKTRREAHNKIIEKLTSYYKENHTGSNLKEENLDRLLEKWMKEKTNAVYDAFKQNASHEWKKMYA